MPPLPWMLPCVGENASVVLANPPMSPIALIERGSAGGGGHTDDGRHFDAGIGEIPTVGGGEGSGAGAIVGGPDSLPGVHDLIGIERIDGDVAGPVADAVAD